MIYFIEQELKFVKIGYTAQDPDIRIRALQCGNPHEMRLFAVIDGTKDLEWALHKLFQPYHIRNEWFVLSPEIIAYVNKHREGLRPLDAERFVAIHNKHVEMNADS
jgi:hypothetical protein